MNQQHVWREGKYIDVWSLNHTLFGYLSAFTMIELFRFSLLTSCLIGLVAYIVWEVFEVFIKVGEYPTNQVMDVVVSLIGFWVFVLIRNYNYGRSLALVNPFLVCFIILECFGYYAKLTHRAKSTSSKT